jgi:hypothetical protein
MPRIYIFGTTPSAVIIQKIRWIIVSGRLYVDDSEKTVEAVKTFFSTIWKYWKKFGHFMGDLVGRVVLMLFYLTIALPFGIFAALATDSLHIRDRAATGSWIKRTSPADTIEASYNQF